MDIKMLKKRFHPINLVPKGAKKEGRQKEYP